MLISCASFSHFASMVKSYQIQSPPHQRVKCNSDAEQTCGIMPPLTGPSATT
jgi:hypothetical protein